MTHPFQDRSPNVEHNASLRIPQQEAFLELVRFAQDPTTATREVGIILPVGCGKSGCICIAPFAFQSKRSLIVAPGITIAKQLHDDLDVANPKMFYKVSQTLPQGPYPELVEIRGTSTNRSDLDESHIVVTNIQQLQGAANRWLNSLPDDYFDLILVDEGHHNVASSWDVLRNKFPAARIVNFSATPLRADGQLMAGEVLYSYPVSRAIEQGYIKRLKAVVLNPRTLRYVRQEDGREIEVSLEELRRLGESDSEFRRSILSSKESLNTIVDASIRELQKLRAGTGDDRLKIIASAMHRTHCIQVVEAYRERNMRVDYVHALESDEANKRVLAKLENHELDVIVQVRKLAEGFDHKYLAVAAVLNVFSNLSPFIQFVGRIMRVIEQDAPGHPKNHGVVVFHAGANIARRWSDFQQYSQADQEYFDQLLPMEELDFSSADELEIVPTSATAGSEGPALVVSAQSGIQIEEIPLIEDPEAFAALQILKTRGYTSEEIRSAFDTLEPVEVTKVRQRQARRKSLDTRVKTEAARLLKQRGINPEGKELDRRRLGKSNLIIVKGAIDNEIRTVVGGKGRSELSKAELDAIDREFATLVGNAIAKVL